MTDSRKDYRKKCSDTENALTSTVADTVLVGIGAAALSIPFYGFLPILATIGGIFAVCGVARACRTAREAPKK